MSEHHVSVSITCVVEWYLAVLALPRVSNTANYILFSDLELITCKNLTILLHLPKVFLCQGYRRTSTTIDSSRKYAKGIHDPCHSGSLFSSGPGDGVSLLFTASTSRLLSPCKGLDGKGACRRRGEGLKVSSRNETSSGLTEPRSVFV